MDKMILVFICSFLISCGPREAQNDCSILKQGTFKYLGNIGDPSAYFVVNGGQHIEYHKDKKYEIESRVTWTGDCTYEMEMVRTNYETFPFKKGDKIKIEIKKVEGDTIHYTATVNQRQSWNSKVLKVGE